ncbi:unnamed protein product [Dibothriocephalus latus]|uniref:Uncharacterized protein n=1 Tax=Dibothriocephalus latus TaxID=60516 RepID=A0A3P6TY33_DIBLA|nr:unnamed protein product [Dibothriocephalus latus]
MEESIWLRVVLKDNCFLLVGCVDHPANAIGDYELCLRLRSLSRGLHQQKDTSVLPLIQLISQQTKKLSKEKWMADAVGNPVVGAKLTADSFNAFLSRTFTENSAAALPTIPAWTGAVLETIPFALWDVTVAIRHFRQSYSPRHDGVPVSLLNSEANDMFKSVRLNLSDYDQFTIKISAGHALKDRNQISSPSTEEKKVLKNLKPDKTITKLPADRGGSTAILKKADYELKMLSVLKDSSTYDPLPTDPTKKQMSSIEKVLKRLTGTCVSSTTVFGEVQHLPESRESD